jgi:alkylation response protein AidB-like acyl-CoA dehydrogenase
MSVIGSTRITFDDEHAMLLDYASSYCRDNGGSAVARQFLEAEDDYSAEQWEAMVAMGWTGIGLPEAVGGSLGIGAAVPVIESMGRNLMGTPLMSSLLTGQLLLRAGGARHEEILAAFASGAKGAVATLESGDWFGPISTRIEGGRLFGEKQLVADAASADFLMVSALRDGEPVLALVAAGALEADAVRPRTLTDLTHRAADIHFTATEVVEVFAGDNAVAALRDYWLLGALLVAAESTGAAASCLDTVVDYLKTRKQFGKLIGSYQALKHPTVDILTAVDSSRSFVYHAASLVSAQALDKDADIACRMAKAQATDTLKYAGDRAVQFHGGMGFTWECDAQLYARRAQWAQQQFGDAQHHRRRLAALLLD